MKKPSFRRTAIPGPRMGVVLAASLLLVSTVACDSPSPTTRIREIQGRGHTSPLQGSQVRDVPGIVTAIDPAGEDRGFWMQDPKGDGDPATSEGLFVATGGVAVEVAIGHAVMVNGTVEEGAARDTDLTTTRVRANAIRIVASGKTLPPPVVLGRDGRRPPAETISDGLDFYESLEGMRVEVRDAVVVGATSSYGEIVVVADRGHDATLRSPNGALVLRPEDDNPERLWLGSRLQPDPPQADVGARFTAPIVGVLDYSFGNFKIEPERALPPVEPGPQIDETTRLVGTERQLTVATFNLLNLSARSPAEKLDRLAADVVEKLAAPDVLALQEVQDRTGPEDDGVVDATATFEALIGAIEAAGGPRYAFRQIDPLDGADGGQPGGNIRVGYLFNPARVTMVDRGRAGPTDPTAAESAGDGLHLTLSPGRVAPQDFAGTRKPLAVELLFRGRRLFLLNLNLTSKQGDDPLMGRRQPPQRPSEVARTREVEVLRRFMESLLAIDPEARVVVVGDMNEHDHRHPMQVLAAEPWVNLLARVPREDRYTYVYQGNAQVLDNVVLSPALAAGAEPEIDLVHVEAHLADSRHASDHDPILVRLSFD